MNNNQSKQKNIFLIIIFKIFLIFYFYLRTVKTRGANNLKEHKADGKNGEGAEVTWVDLSQHNTVSYPGG